MSRERFFAWWYPRMMAKVEAAGQAAYRARLLSRATGVTVDVGTGTGLSVPHYTDAVDRLVLVEPNPHMHPALEATLTEQRPPIDEIAVTEGDAYALPFADDSVDTISASLLFCSLKQPGAALAEMHRVLRPGGRLLFHEHVLGTGRLATAQRVLAPLQAALADGCRPTQDFEALLERSPFDVVSIERTEMPTSLPTIRPLVLGEAVA